MTKKLDRSFILTQKYLKECLLYDPLTGIFSWRERPTYHFEGTKRKAISTRNHWNSRFKDKKPGYISENGYLRITINNKSYNSHRLAFLYMDGYTPENMVDHIDQVKANNRWDNLREVNNSCNMQNRKINLNNRSGVTGVGRDRGGKSWVANIRVNKKTKHLGTYKNKQDAIKSRYKEECDNPLWVCSENSTAKKYLKENNML